eukprot:2832535-Pleurochrysis_carterae.AAC.1
MLISGSCSPPDPSSAFECPTVNANSVADMAIRSQAVVGMFRFVRSVVGESAWRRDDGLSGRLRYGNTRGSGGLLRATLAGADAGLERGAGTGVIVVLCCDSRESRTCCSRASRKRPVVVALSRMPAPVP